MGAHLPSGRAFEIRFGFKIPPKRATPLPPPKTLKPNRELWANNQIGERNQQLWPSFFLCLRVCDVIAAGATWQPNKGDQEWPEILANQHRQKG